MNALLSVQKANGPSTCGKSHHDALPFRFDVRVASDAELNHANIERTVRSEPPFKRAARALSDINRPLGSTDEGSLTSWVCHPDERVAIAAVQAMRRYRSEGADPQIIERAMTLCAARACRDAAIEHSLWTPLLDACGEAAGVGDARTIVEVLDTQRSHVDHWVRTHGTPRIGEQLLSYTDTAIRQSVVWGLHTYDESLAQCIATQADAYDLCIERPLSPQLSACFSVLSPAKCRLLQRCAAKAVCNRVRHIGVDENQLLPPVLILMSLERNGLQFTPEEIDALIACIPLLSARGLDEVDALLWHVLADCPELSAAQIVDVFLVRPRLTDSDVSLFPLLAHPHAPAEVVRAVAITLRGTLWNHAVKHIIQHREVIADPNVRARLQNSRKPPVLAALCRSARGEEFAQLFRRMLEGYQGKRSWTRRTVVALELLEEDPSRIQWLQPPDLTPLFQSPRGDVRLRALQVLGVKGSP